MSRDLRQPSSTPSPDDRGGSPLPWRVVVSAVVVLTLIALLVITLYLPTPSGRSSARTPNAVSPIVPAPTLNVSTATGSVIDAVEQTTPLRASPNGPVIASLSARTQFGTPRVVAVLKAVPGWLGVIAPELHNGRLGWIPARTGQLARVHYSVRVQTGSRVLTVFRDGHVERTMPVAVGQAAAPTPPGIFAVTDKLRFQTPSAAYGCCALGLSAHEYHLLPGWTGQDLVAIHSTPDAASVGKPVSHGCVRVSLTQGRWLIDHIPLGALVTIRAT